MSRPISGSLRTRSGASCELARVSGSDRHAKTGCLAGALITGGTLTDDESATGARSGCGQQVVHRRDQAFHRINTLLEVGGFSFGQVQFDDLLDSAAAHDDGNAHVVAADTVFVFTKCGDRNASFLVFDNRFDHLGARGGGCVVRAAGLQQGNDFRTALAGPIDDLLETIRIDQLSDRNATDAGAARDLGTLGSRKPDKSGEVDQ